MGRPTREERIERYRDKVQERIVNCPSCQPVDDGVVWVLGARIDLRDLLDNVGVPEEEAFRDEVLEGITCPGCGDEISSWDEVGTQFPFEREHEKTLQRAEARYDAKLLAFAQHLESFPMLGAAHAVGKRILKEIASFPKSRLEKSTWFRARRIKDGRDFTADDLRVPDPDCVVVSPGRFNHLGQAHWYLASDEDTAVREVVEKGETRAWLQRWAVGPMEPILGLETFGPDDERADVRQVPLLAAAMIFGGHLNRPSDRERGWKPEYFLPHYIADAAKRAGFRGIQASSTRWHGTNLIVFDRDAPIEPDGEPEILNLKAYFKGARF